MNQAVTAWSLQCCVWSTSSHHGDPFRTCLATLVCQKPKSSWISNFVFHQNQEYNMKIFPLFHIWGLRWFKMDIKFH